MNAARRFGLADALLTIFLLALIFTFAITPFFMRAKGVSDLTRCSHNLRQIALAYVQYGDDKRFLPHMGPTNALSGDASTNHPTKSVRTVIWYGYHDNPEALICPSSVDIYVPIQNNEVRENMRLWSWGSEGGANTVPPWRQGDDPTLLESEELSYGMTRRGLNHNVKSTVVLGADRGVRRHEDWRDIPKATLPGDVGNHSEGWNVAKADATVEFFPKAAESPKEGLALGDWLRSTAKGDPALAISWRADPNYRR